MKTPTAEQLQHLENLRTKMLESLENYRHFANSLFEEGDGFRDNELVHKLLKLSDEHDAARQTWMEYRKSIM